MSKSNSIGIAVILSSGLLWHAPSHAVDYIGKLAIGQKSSALNIRDRSFSPDFLTLDISLTAAIDNLFLTVNRELSIKDDIETDPGGLIFYSREDLNITFGYGFEDVTVFGGVRSGETNANYTGNNGAFGTSSEGVYLGVSSSYYLEGAGNFTGSMAIASLDGQVSLSEPFVDTSAFTVLTPPAVIQGSAVGFSISIGWQAQVSASTIASFDWKLNQFNFEDNVVFGGLDLSYEENFSTFYIGLTHFFEE